MMIPINSSLPFFAYGIFKPGQIAYPRIKAFVEKIENTAVKGILKERDGVPLLCECDFFQVYGCLIYFDITQQEKAYQSIAEIEPKEIYKWTEIQTESGFKANALFGRKENRGSTDIEHCHEWDGSSDPMLLYGLIEVKRILDEKIASDVGRNEAVYSRLFRLQMAYTLLWSIIERYSTIKYGFKDSPTERVQKLAEDNVFVKSLQANVKRIRSVYSTDKLDNYKLDPSDPKKALKYYYQVRSNVVHRGKSVSKDVTTLELSLCELFLIFTDVLNTAFSSSL